MDDLGAIVDRLQTLLGPLTRDPEPLEGGITNRNYRIGFDGRDFVLRLPGKDTALLGISREAEWIASDSAARLGLAPAVAAHELDFLVTEYVPCRPLSPEEVRADPAPIGRALRIFHDRAAPLPVAFWVPELLDAYAAVVRDRGGRLPEGYGIAQRLARRIGEVLPAVQAVPCHDDLLAANLLAASDGRTLVVDWEYAGMGHRLFDLGNLAVNNDLDESAERALLEAYLEEPPSEVQLAGLRLMRLMSDAREAAWGVVQAVISELDFDFDAYAERHFDRLTAAAEDRRLEEWLGAAAA